MGIRMLMEEQDSWHYLGYLSLSWASGGVETLHK